MARHKTHKRTHEGRSETLARRARRAAKYAAPTLDIDGILASLTGEPQAQAVAR